MPERGKKRGLIYNPRILVTGGNGFFGKNLIPVLEKHYSRGDIVNNQGSNFFDLTRQNHTETMFKAIRQQGYIDCVVHLAAYSGGMFENIEGPASFWYQNTMMVANVIEQCASHKVKKLLIPFGGCSYPDIGKDIYSEEDLWNGFPHINSFGYSMAKKQAVVGAMAYEKQFGLKTITVIPTNPIGPWDNVSQEQAHVPMALIGRFLEAKKEGYSTVTVFGSGRPERDFLYIGDIVKLFPYLLDLYNSTEPMNISSGVGKSITELAETIAKVVGFDGKIHYDRSKPDGQKRKILSNLKLQKFLSENSIQWEPTPLEEAITITAEWYEKRVLGR